MLNIKDPKVHRLARKLAALTGESLSKAVRLAVHERLERERRRRRQAGSADRLMAIGRRCAARPVLASRPADELLGYDEAGLPS
jgi:antitoxin VapB